MNITRENIDDLNAVIKVNIVKADYQEKVNDVLKDYKKKANIKGFRPGKVPFGRIKSMYGPAVQVEEINKIISESLTAYITEEKIEILGDPIPKMDENDKVDFDNEEDFAFSFEIGLVPEFEIKLSAKNKLPYYEIKIDKKLREGYLDNYKRRFGEQVPASTIAGNDIIKGHVYQLNDTGDVIEEGISAENSTIAVNVIKDEEIKKAFLGKNKNDKIDFDIKKAFPNDTEIAAILQVDKDKAPGIEGNFRVSVIEINRFKEADINQELFDKVYGEGEIKSEEEFRKRVDAEISENLKKESDYKAMIDARELAIEKTSFDLPEEFLKRWLIKVNKELSHEQVEEEFPAFLKDLRWQLIRNKTARDNEFKVEEEDMMREARNFTKIQFQQYGLFNAADEQVNNFAKEMLKREEDSKKIAEKVIEDKVVGKIRELIKLEPKKITADEFNKMLNN